MCKNEEINKEIYETKQKVGVFRFGRVSGSGFGSGFVSGSEPETRPKPARNFLQNPNPNRRQNLQPETALLLTLFLIMGLAVRAVARWRWCTVV